MLEVMPSIDISGGIAVKRVRGQRGTGLILGDPLRLAQEVYGDGYDKVHIVDLDAAEGVGSNEDVIRRICREVGFSHVQVGGGIRSIEKARRLLRDCDYIVVSTLPVTDPSEFEELVREVGRDRVLVSIDYDEQGNVLIRGWRERGSVKVEDLLSLDVYGFIFTYIPREGTGEGIDESVRLYASRVRGVREYAGGINTVNDLVRLREFGFNYAIVGMSFYNGALRGVRFV